MCSLMLVGLTGCDVDSKPGKSSQPKQRAPVAKFKQVEPVEDAAMGVDVPLGQQREIAAFINEGIAQARADGTDSPAQREAILQEAAARFGVSQDAVEAIHAEQANPGESKEKSGAGGVYEETAARDLQLAEEGDAAAQYRLGMRYLAGDGVPRDFGLATQWFHRAAEQYHVAAMDELANAYHAGRGVDRDLVTAAAWAIIATSLQPDSPQLQLTRQVIASELTYLEEEEAQRRASMWLSSLPPGG